VSSNFRRFNIRAQGRETNNRLLTPFYLFFTNASTRQCSNQRCTHHCCSAIYDRRTDTVGYAHACNVLRECVMIIFQCTVNNTQQVNGNIIRPCHTNMCRGATKNVRTSSLSNESGQYGYNIRQFIYLSQFGMTRLTPIQWTRLVLSPLTRLVYPISVLWQVLNRLNVGGNGRQVLQNCSLSWIY